jgi:hypothetical protein
MMANSLSRKAGEGNRLMLESNTFPRPFRGERGRVRAISFSVDNRKLMNHFVVKVLFFAADVPH